MIVSISQRISQELDEIQRLERILNEAGAVRATLELLGEIEPVAVRSTATFRLISDRLPVAQVGVLRSQFGVAKQLVKASHQDFSKERRQVQALNAVSVGLRSVTEGLQRDWQDYSQQQVQPQADLLRLVESLPELADQIEDLRGLHRQLASFVVRTPVCQEDLDNFDQTLARLQVRLARLEGLSDGVKKFLRRVLNDEATIADLSEEVLNWCRPPSRVTAFRIAFATRKAIPNETSAMR
jgi:hypothetical protein